MADPFNPFSSSSPSSSSSVSDGATPVGDGYVSADVRAPPVPPPIPKPVQIISLDGGKKKFLLNLDQVNEILCSPAVHDKPVVVVSIAGPFRKGKSFLLNFFIRYLEWEESGAEGPWMGDPSKPLEGFKWRSGDDRETTGIWMWNKPYLRKLPSGEEVAIVLVDTQGTFDNETTMQQNATIFALNSLLSSFQIYNISGLLQEDVLQHMHLFTSFGRLVRSHEDEISADSTPPFQTLQFLVRDWVHKKNHAWGAEGGAQYLEKVLSDEKRDGNPELVNVRRDLRACFEQLSCFLLPSPGELVTENEDFQGAISDIRPDFVDHVSAFVPRVLGRENLVVKTFYGEEVSCEGLSQYLRKFVEIFHFDGTLPEVQTVFDATASINHSNMKHTSFLHYQTSMAAFCGPSRPYVEVEALEREHVRLNDEAVQMYREAKKLYAPELEAAMIAELEAEMLNVYTDLAEANRNKQLLASLRTPITYGVAAFVSNLLCSLFSLMYLSGISAIFFYITWLCLLAIGVWGYCSATGKFPEVSVQLDGAAKKVYAFAIEHILPLIMQYKMK